MIYFYWIEHVLRIPNWIKSIRNRISLAFSNASKKKWKIDDIFYFFDFLFYWLPSKEGSMLLERAHSGLTKRENVIYNIYIKMYENSHFPLVIFFLLFVPTSKSTKRKLFFLLFFLSHLAISAICSSITLCKKLNKRKWLGNCVSMKIR